jgi:TIR domain
MLTFFISYRREDSAGYAGRLYDRLSAHFGAEHVFMDIDTLEPGVDFVEVIEDAISKCDILVVIIGKRWLSITDATEQRRLDNPDDFVRVEVQAGLERDIRVIPVLVGGAAMPSSRDLPEALTKLARRNALELSDTRWHADVGRLIEIAEKLAAAAQHRAEEEQRRREEADAAQRRAEEERQRREETEAAQRRAEEEQQQREQAAAERRHAEEERRQREEAEAVQRRTEEEQRKREEAETAQRRIAMEGSSLSLSQAAQAISVTRGTLRDYIKSGRIKANPNGTIEAAELLRAGFIIRQLPRREEAEEEHQQREQAAAAQRHAQEERPARQSIITNTALQSSRSGPDAPPTPNKPQDTVPNAIATCPRCGHRWTGHWHVSLKSRQCPQCGKGWRVT